VWSSILRKGSGSGRIKPRHEATLEASVINVYLGGDRRWRGFRNRIPRISLIRSPDRQVESASTEKAMKKLFGRGYS